MLRLFRDTDQLAIFLISMLALVLWYFDLRQAPSIENTSAENIAPLGEMVLQWLKNLKLLYASICFIFLLGIGFFLVRINTKFILTMRRTQLPALFFILFMGGFTNVTTILLPLFAGFLFCIALERMFLSYKKSRLVYNFFDASFLITVGSLFYAPALLFNVMVFYALARLRALSWREWFLAILGIVAPLFIYHSIVFVVTGTINISVLNRIIFLPGIYFPWDHLISKFLITVIGLLLMIASFDIASGFQLKKIITRKVYHILFANFILAVFLFLLIKNVEAGVLVFGTISLAYLFTHYFSLIRFNWFREIAFDLLILMVIAKKLIPLIIT